MFLRTSFHAAGDYRGRSINPLYKQKILAVADNRGVEWVRGGMTKGEEIDGVEDISLADTVAANHAINLRRQVERGLPDVFIVDE
jgi:hypothetical protein